MPQLIEVMDEFDKELKPRSKAQEIFASADGSIKELLFGGAAGGSKTFSLVVDPIMKKCHEMYGFQGAIYRRTYPQIRESIEVESNKWYPRAGFKYNATDHVWVKKRNGRTYSKIMFIHAEQEKDVFAHDSAAYDYLGFDELTQFTEFMYRYLFHRNRPNISNWKPYVRAGATPGDIGNTWVRDRFVVPGGVAGYKIIKVKHNDGTFHNRMFIPSFAQDNPVLMHRDPTYLTTLQVLPEALKKAKLYGDWWAFQGQVFTEFRNYRYPDEPENALHVIPPFDRHSPTGGIPKSWIKIVAIDPGYRHHTWIGFGAIHPITKVLYIYREIMLKETDIKIWARDMKRISQYDGKFYGRICDTAAWDEEGLGTSIIEQIESASGWRFTQANKDRIGGKMLLHEMFRWAPIPQRYDVNLNEFDMEYAQKLFRIKGKRAYEDYIQPFIPDDTNEVLPKIQIFDTCPNLINIIQSVVYDEKKVEDVKKVDGDDPYDGLRYLCQEYIRLVKGNLPMELTREMAIAEATQELEKTNDWNAFYHRMAILDQNSKKVLQAFDSINIRKHTRAIIH